MRTILTAFVILGTTANYAMAGNQTTSGEQTMATKQTMADDQTIAGAPPRETPGDDGTTPALNGGGFRRPSAMFSGGPGIPTGEFSNNQAEVGVGGTLRVEVPWGSRLSLGPSLGFHRFAIDLDGPPSLQGRWEIGTFGLGAASVVREGASVFAGVGVALPDLVATIDEPFGSDEEKVSIDASPFLEGGLRLGLARGPFVELMYSHIFTNGKKAKNDGEYLPIELPYDVHWFAAKFGFRLTL